MPSTKLGKLIISYINSREFHSIKNEIFNTQIYATKLQSETPIILDIGAHIGLATLYFKQQWPGGTVFAFEPNPVAFKLLEENIWQNGLQNVEAYNIAIAGSDGKRKLYIPANDVSWDSNSSFTNGSWSKQEAQQPVEIEARRLAKILEKLDKVDLLKIDVEGAEFEIFKDIQKNLMKINEMIIEIHPESRQRFKEMTARLLADDFTIEIWQNGKIVRQPDFSKLFIMKARQSA
ncbi:MAG: FkbM family methyltransferase [Candidatus Dojkabacteria bacterium]|nr:MAG: FkbM family methyltransferase [Candidatus Dojkabacteria bacterium]